MALNLGEIFELESEEKFIKELKTAMREEFFDITVLNDVCRSANKEHIFTNEKYFNKVKEKITLNELIRNERKKISDSILKNIYHSSSYIFEKTIDRYSNYDEYSFGDEVLVETIKSYFKDLNINRRIKKEDLKIEHMKFLKNNSNYVLILYIESGKLTDDKFSDFSSKNNRPYHTICIITDEKDILEFMNNFINDCVELYNLKKKSHSLLDDFFGSSSVNETNSNKENNDAKKEVKNVLI